MKKTLLTLLMVVVMTALGVCASLYVKDLHVTGCMQAFRYTAEQCLYLLRYK